MYVDATHCSYLPTLQTFHTENFSPGDARVILRTLQTVPQRHVQMGA